MKGDILDQFQNQKTKNFMTNNSWTELAKVKMRGASRETKRYMRQYPIGGYNALFGLHLVKDTDNIIVVTEG